MSLTLITDIIYLCIKRFVLYMLLNFLIKVTITLKAVVLYYVA